MAPKAVLVGLPGSGKSTIGRRLAKALGVGLLDTDVAIEQRTGRSIADIFATDGEQEFRRIELRVVVAAVLAATVVLGAVVCAAYGLTIVASAMSIYALGVGAWLYHAIERLILARRISTVRTAAKPLQPLLPVMAAIMGLTQAVVRSLGDVTDLPARRRELSQLPVLRWVDNSGNRANRRIADSDDLAD